MFPSARDGRLSTSGPFFRKSWRSGRTERAGWRPAKPGTNANLLCQARDLDGVTFPWSLKTQRIAPGQKNTWYLEIYGTKASARFSTKNPKRLEILEYSGGEQDWREIDTGYTTAFKTITGDIFEFGFTDSILQMLAAFFYEVGHGRPLQPAAGCVTPGETALSHRLFTAALASQKMQATVAV
jgi:predicted dehydrogenase